MASTPPDSERSGYVFARKTLVCDTLAFWSNEVIKSRNRLLEYALRSNFVAHWGTVQF
jgi:hypothetical protein